MEKRVRKVRLRRWCFIWGRWCWQQLSPLCATTRLGSGRRYGYCRATAGLPWVWCPRRSGCWSYWCCLARAAIAAGGVGGLPNAWWFCVFPLPFTSHGGGRFLFCPPPGLVGSSRLQARGLIILKISLLRWQPSKKMRLAWLAWLLWMEKPFKISPFSKWS